MEYFIVFVVELLLLFFLSRKLTSLLWLFLNRLFKNGKKAQYIFAIIFLPGTFIHELSHFLMALVLLVPVAQFDLLPEFQDGRMKLGSTPIAKTDVIRKALVGFAPVIFGLTIIFTILYLLTIDKFIGGWLGYVLTGWLIFEVGNTMFLSKEDLKGILELTIIFLAVIASLYLLGIRVSFASPGFIGINFIYLIKKVNLFMLVPVIIDILLIGLFNFKKGVS